VLKRVVPILGGFSRDDYVTERLWAAAPDGTEVPVSLVYRKGLAKKDGSDHMLLHGYGSYEYPYDPRYEAIDNWVDEGHHATSVDEA
jgi:oligopeptidase B